jgi:hypothetical protein
MRNDKINNDSSLLDSNFITVRVYLTITEDSGNDLKKKIFPLDKLQRGDASITS